MESTTPLAVLGAARLALRTTGAQSWSEGPSLFPDTGTWLWAGCSTVLATGLARLAAALRVTRGTPAARAGSAPVEDPPPPMQQPAAGR